MKRYLIIIIVLFHAIAAFGQIDTVQYKSVFPEKFVFQSENNEGYDTVRSFTVNYADLIMESGNIISFTLKSGKSAKVSYNVMQMISETPYVKTFWVNKSEKYFVTISFPRDRKNGMTIRFFSNVDGSILYRLYLVKVSE